MDYEAWEAHRELDRMPDPNVNPCESVQAENADLRIALAVYSGRREPWELGREEQQAVTRALALLSE